VINPFFSRAVLNGYERAMVPMAFFGVFLAVAVFISPWYGSAGGHLTGARLWVAVISVCGGITVAWWQSRYARSGRP
jgi:hypothetical protein